MCLAVPGKIISISQKEGELRMAKVSFSGVVKDICIEWVPEADVGDYILAHVGTALSKLNEEEAQETLRVFNEWAESLEDENEVDDR